MAMYKEVIEPDEDKDNLSRIKDSIATSYIYFKDNYDRYHDFRTFVFKESINDQQKAMLRKSVRPVIEFNILEAFISRLLGEFSKHEPSIEVTPSEGVPIDQKVIDFVESHFRHSLYEANKSSFAYEVYKDLLSGGFSVAKVWTDYASPMSFNQEIYIGRVFDPTLCGFDPMSRASHKGDGDFCFEIYPLTEKEFKRQFPEFDTGKLKYSLLKESQDIEGFNWSYKDMKDNKIILVADYYEKKKKRTKIVKLADGRQITKKDYKKMEQYWQEQQFIEQIPVIISERWTMLEIICRYRIMENMILEYVETDYSYLPLVFIDGNSIILSHGKVNSTYQMTRPYVYHAKGIQDLKNFSGQCLANYLQNMVQHKFIIKKEAIPQDDDSLEALKNIQRANTIIVQAYSEDNPELPIPDPIREVMNVPAPPEVMGTFQITEPTTQVILGSFASNLGQNNRDLSGKAVIETASIENAAAMPYVIGYLSGLTQIACIFVDLIPKYIVGKRTVSVLNKDSSRGYQEVNSLGNPMLDYSERALKVNVEAGVNFQVQKNQAVEQIIALTGANETLGKFFTSEKGLKLLAKNLTIYGADNLEEAIDEFMQQQQQEQQQAMQMQQQAAQSDPRMIKAQADMQKAQLQGQNDQMKIQLEAQELQMKQQQQEFDNQISISKQAIDKILADAKIMESEAKISQAQIDSAVRLEESETSLQVHSLETAAKIAEIESRHHDMKMKEHEHGLKVTELEHNMNMSKKNKGDE